MRKNIIIVIILMSISIANSAQTITMELWEQGKPGNNEAPKNEEFVDGKMVAFVSEPKLYIYLPEKSSEKTAAVVICPGGGYWIEAMEHEGYDFASFLQSRGIAGIVLKYRLPYGHHEIPLTDAQHAIRTVRANAEKWGIDANKIGIAGFSAGGHLASTAATHFENVKEIAIDSYSKISCRPDFAILVYPVITMNKQWTHLGSRENLLGKNPNKNLIKLYSNELHISTKTPPTFLILASDDNAVPPQNSIEYYNSLIKNGVSTEMHIFSEGGHGFGMNKTGKAHDLWTELLLKWLQTQNFI